jgi:hypothetical protein
MPNDPNSDLQITTPGAGAQQTNGQNGASATAQPVITPAVNAAGSTAAAPVSAQPVVTSAAQAAATPVQPVPAAGQPLNKRAFNLDADVEESATGQAVPEKFAIPKIVREKYPDLIELIKVTESMDDQERQYWFQIMPVMTPEQIEKFRGILITEKQQLAELDKEYEDELNKLNEKHLLEWKEFESKEKSKAIKEAEAKSSVEEKQLEEDLLAKLSNV